MTLCLKGIFSPLSMIWRGGFGPAFVATTAERAGEARKGILGLSFCLLASCLNSSDPLLDSPQATVRFIDVGQGDAILVSLKGKHLLIDAGKKEKGLTILALMDSLNIDSLDAVLATHPDADHIGGFIPIFRSGLLKGPVIYRHLGTSTEVSLTFFHLLDSLNLLTYEPLPLDTLSIMSPLVMRFLSPPKSLISDNKAYTNTNSIVCQLSLGETEILLAGDITFETEKFLLSIGSIESDILMIPHHGSGKSTTVTLLGAIAPRLGIISVGKNNAYGHPSESLMLRLESMKISILRTDEAGTITIQLSQNGFQIL